MIITLRERHPLTFWKTTLVTYEGDGTVWHNIETGRRADTITEMRLSEIEWKRKRDAAKARSGND